MQFTIDSDQEIDIQDNLTDDEDESLEGPIFQLQFEDENLFLNKERILNVTGERIAETTRDLMVEKLALREISGHDDNVRSMPKMEERASRALEKSNRRDSYNQDTGMGEDEEKNFFDSIIDSEQSAVPSSNPDILFSQLNLSRPLLRAVELLGYVTPTVIQAQVIPIALAGRDICASAITGSGKTAAFLLPVLERLLYRPRETAETRILVVTPTRELATQIYDVLRQLSQFTDVTSALICGGKRDVRSQESLLRNRPDVIVCTPGRIIDHLRNSKSVTVSNLDVLVLDEADRLLELGFQEEIEELLRHCPVNRQTLLFSATMTAKVDDLVKLSLKRPVRVRAEAGRPTVAPRLVQEFIKLRNEADKEAILAALVCKSGFCVRCIVFFETKQSVHRFYSVLSLLGVPVSELHGDMTQPQREMSLKRFRAKETEVLVATDVAARGLDIPVIRTVVNAEMPRSANTYIHRVGRTARAGTGGRSITILPDDRRKVMKEVLRGEAGVLTATGSGQILSRVVPREVLDHFKLQIASFESKLAEMAIEEQTNLKWDEAEREAERAEHLLMYEDEIKSRPARTWHQSVSAREELKQESLAQVKQLEEELRSGAGNGKALDPKAMMNRLARSDNYRLDEEDVEGGRRGEGKHRLSRKKRRRMDALKEEAEAASSSEPGYGRGVVGGTPGATTYPKKAKVLAKKKEKVKQKEKEFLVPEKAEKSKKRAVERTDGDGGIDGERKKVRRPKFAIGGFDQDMSEWNGDGGVMMSKKKLKKLESEKAFVGFDANKELRKGGKPKGSFKSKGRFKRR